MLVMLFAVSVIALTLLALLLAGVLVAIATGIALLNVFVVIVGLRIHPPPHAEERAPARWRPSSFRRPPRPEQELDEESEQLATRLTIHRQ
jgi:uncharacterized membrane protein YdfJ with MMPL/SSD domain